MSNIAEGYEGQTTNVFVRLLGIANGSAGEVRSQLYVALDQKSAHRFDKESVSSDSRIDSVP